MDKTTNRGREPGGRDGARDQARQGGPTFLSEREGARVARGEGPPFPVRERGSSGRARAGSAFLGTGEGAPSFISLIASCN